MVGCDVHSDTFLIKISRNPSVFNVTEDMLFSLNKSSRHRLPLQNAMRVQVIFLEKMQERSEGTYLIDTYSMSYGLELSIFGSWFMVFLKFWLVVYGPSQFLARGNSCRKIFGSWWLVDIVVINVLARGGLWWLLVACGGSLWLVVARVLF